MSVNIVFKLKGGDSWGKICTRKAHLCWWLAPPHSNWDLRRPPTAPRNSWAARETSPAVYRRGPCSSTVCTRRSWSWAAAVGGGRAHFSRWRHWRAPEARHISNWRASSNRRFDSCLPVVSLSSSYYHQSTDTSLKCTVCLHPIGWRIHSHTQTHSTRIVRDTFVCSYVRSIWAIFGMSMASRLRWRMRAPSPSPTARLTNIARPIWQLADCPRSPWLFTNTWQPLSTFFLRLFRPVHPHQLIVQRLSTMAMVYSGGDGSLRSVSTFHTENISTSTLTPVPVLTNVLIFKFHQHIP